MGLLDWRACVQLRNVVGSTRNFVWSFWSEVKLVGFGIMCGGSGIFSIRSGISFGQPWLALILSILHYFLFAAQMQIYGGDQRVRFKRPGDVVDYFGGEALPAALGECAYELTGTTLTLA